MRIGNNNVIKNSNISMKNGDISQIITQKNNKIFINGKEIEMPESMFFRNTMVHNNNKTYLNGKEFKNGKWRYTIKSLVNTIF